jgi:hypothetical protein
MRESLPAHHRLAFNGGFLAVVVSIKVAGRQPISTGEYFMKRRVLTLIAVAVFAIATIATSAVAAGGGSSMGRSPRDSGGGRGPGGGGGGHGGGGGGGGHGGGGGGHGWSGSGHSHGGSGGGHGWSGNSHSHGWYGHGYGHSWYGHGYGHGWYGHGYGHGYWYPRWSVWAGGPVYWGAGYGPYYAPYASVYPYAYEAPPAYADPGPASQYYCTDPPGYYPDVPTCNRDWLQVVPRGKQPPSPPPPR